MLDLKKILVAYDASNAAERAYEAGLDLAQKYQAELIVLSVATQPEPPEDVDTEAVLDSARTYYEEHFAKLRQMAAGGGVAPRFEIRVGHPAEQIILLANEENVQAIIMGHRGKSFIKRWLLGSVSKRVISYAHCTVCVVR
jgi:nucleotide-binding universal stress UspA family protein